MRSNSFFSAKTHGGLSPRSERFSPKNKDSMDSQVWRETRGQGNECTVVFHRGLSGFLNDLCLCPKNKDKMDSQVLKETRGQRNECTVAFHRGMRKFSLICIVRAFCGDSEESVWSVSM